MNNQNSTKKQTLLLIYNFNRKDFLTYFHASKSDFNFFFAEFSSPKEVYNHHFREYGKDIYWGQFRDTFDLLEKIKPDKVVFLYIESYFHMALNISCKVLGIPTYLLDHGIQDINIHQNLIKYTTTHSRETRVQILSRMLSQGYDRFSSRLFLIRTIAKLPYTEAKALKYYMSLRKGKNYTSIVKYLNSDLFYADTYLSISPKVGAAFTNLLNYNPPRTFYFGVPTYDCLYNIKPSQTTGKALLFLDQGLHTAGFLGWTNKYFETFITDFTGILLRHGYKIYIKKHPRQLPSDWQLLEQQKKVSVITDEELTLLLPKIKVVIGFFSTYLLPLAALEHITLITLENHPVGNTLVSKSFVDAGVAHPVYDLEELHMTLPSIEKLHQEQLSNKKKFEEDWLFRFDGKSGERLRDLLLDKNK